MTLGLTVVTHTDSKSCRDISRCVESVNAALPAGCNHLIIDLGKVSETDFVKARYKAMGYNDIVVFVDDDDFIHPDSLRHCVNALSTGAGLAFTSEIIVRPDGTHTPMSVKPPSQLYVCKSPTNIHHMTAFRTKYVTKRAHELALNAGIGIEWIMKADAISNAGCIFVPTVGYYWTQHALQRSRTANFTSSMKAQMAHIVGELSTWGVEDKAIPEWPI